MILPEAIVSIHIIRLFDNEFVLFRISVSVPTGIRATLQSMHYSQLLMWHSSSFFHAIDKIEVL